MNTAAENLAKLKLHILSSWENTVRKSLPGARDESRPALRDHIPDFLNYLVEALREGIEDLRPAIISFAHHHGAERAELSNYTVEEALAEYNILRKIIFSELESHGTILPWERDVIYEAINLGLSKAASEYTKLQWKQLEESEQKFRLFFENAPVGIAEVDTENMRFLNVNPKYCELLGYSKEEFLTLSIEELTHPDDFISDYKIVDLLKDGLIAEFRREKRYRRKDGSYMWAELSVNSYRTEKGDFNIAVAVDISARKSIEEALKQTQDKIELATSYTKIGVWEYDLKSGTSWRTQSHDELFGYHTLLQHWNVERFLSHIHPEDRFYIKHELDKVFKVPAKFRLEFRIVWPDKSVHWMVMRGESIRDENGAPVKLIGTNYNITDIKEAELLLKESTKRLQQITDIQPLLIGQLGRDHRYKFVNMTYSLWFGKPLSKIIGHHMKDVIGDEAYNFLIPYVRRAFTGEKVIFESRVKYLDGNERYVHSTYSPNISANGTVESIYISVIDMTEYQKTLDALKTSEENFRNLANALPQIVWVASPDGNIKWFNEQWYKYTGLKKESMDSDNWKSAHHNDYINNGLMRYYEHIQSGTVWEETLPIRSENGEWRWFLSRSIPVKDSSGNIIQWIGTSTDITEQKSTLDALKEETVLREKFVSTLTHDLRTPLTAAKLSADLIKRKSKEEFQITLATRISDNLARANVMIENLLDASKIRAGKPLIPEIEECNIVELVNRTLIDLASIHGDRFVFKSPDALYVWVDPNGLRRIVENLCTNAIKYGATDEKIRIILEYGARNYMLCVHNEGNPLMNLDKEKLFEPFRRGTEQSIAGKKGWGIGLTIVKGITEAHHGDVSVVTSEEGTTFKILLPRDARRFCENDLQIN